MESRTFKCEEVRNEYMPHDKQVFAEADLGLLQHQRWSAL